MREATLNSHRTRLVPRRFHRSVRLELDLEDPAALDGYEVTPQVLQALNRIEEGLRPGSTERALTLTGPYGTGKSAFALFLTQLVDRAQPATGQAWSILAVRDPDLAQRLRAHVKPVGLLSVPITARRAGLGRCLLEGMDRVARRLPATEAIVSLSRELKEDLLGPSAGGHTAATRLRDLSKAALETGHYRGVLLVVDELGKALEHAARRHEEDVFVLQDLAELASRSGKHPIIVVGILHQAFEQYGLFLDTASRKEWAKIQGRFADIVFVESPEQQMRLLARVAASLGNGMQVETGSAQQAARALAEARILPPGLSAGELEELCIQACPLHPTVLMVLPQLTRRFAQNERSLFAYVLSSEPYSLHDLVASRGPSLVRLSDLFDYFLANLSGSLHHHLATRRWLEAMDVMERAQNLTALELQLLKTIALLNVLGEPGYLRPSEELLSIAVSDSLECPRATVALASLRERSFVILRRFSNTYHLWEGSDVDIEARLDEGRRRTRGQMSMALALTEYLPRRPLAARRHSFEFGALRYFRITYLDASGRAPEPPASDDADGLVVCCLASSASEIKTFRDLATSGELARRPNVVVAVPQEVGALQEAASELQAIHWVWANTAELQSDRVARRELADRTAAVERELLRRLEHLIDPRVEPDGCRCAWFYGGVELSVSSLRDVAQLLSDVMDRVYPSSPRIRNELVNRRKLSSAAAAARRSLIGRMLTFHDQPLLGIKGYPPERSIYESVLLATGLHRENGGWHFGPPPVNDPCGLRPVWEAMKGAIFTSLAQPYRVDELQARLAAPPFGLMPGVFPILLCAFMLAYRNEVSLYRDGAFVPEPAIADYEVLMRRPDLFSVAGSEVAGERALVVHRIARSLGVKAATLPVVRGLLRMVASIPEHGWRTQALSPQALAVRTAFDQARSPERLLFYELPAALGEPGFPHDEACAHDRVEEFFRKLNAAFGEWAEVTALTIARSRDRFLAACGLPTGENGWAHLQALARSLVGKPVEPLLLALVERLTSGQQDATVEGVLALISGKPPRKWSDADRDRFEAQVATIADKFMHAVELHGSLTPEEEALAAELATTLQQKLPEDMPPHVVRAVLRRMLQEI